jgi:hypothetical protein
MTQHNQVVPVEPTDETITQIEIEVVKQLKASGIDSIPQRLDGEKIYAVALAAAPQQPVGDEFHENQWPEWCVRLFVALAKRCLAEANAEVGDTEWPAGQQWDELGHTSQHAFLRKAAAESGIDYSAYQAALKSLDDATADRIDEVFTEMLSAHRAKAQTAQQQGEAYAIECGISNGDGTFSVHIRKWPLPSYEKPHPEWPVKYLYTTSPSFEQAIRMAAEICQQEGDEWDSDAVVTEKNYAHACRDRILALSPPSDSVVMTKADVEAIQEVLRISDRKHDAWDKAKLAVSRAMEGK